MYVQGYFFVSGEWCLAVVLGCYNCLWNDRLSGTMGPMLTFWSVCVLLVHMLGISQYLWSSLVILMILKRQLKKWSESTFPGVDFPCCGLCLSDSIRVLAPRSNDLNSCSTLFPLKLSPSTLLSVYWGSSSLLPTPPNNKTISKSYHSLKLPENYLRDLYYFMMQNRLFPINLYLTHQINLEPSLSQLKSASSWKNPPPQHEFCTFSKCRSSWS